MKKLQMRMLLQIGLGFLLGRVNIFGCNPIGVGYFAAGYTQKGARIPVLISVVLGMLTEFPMDNVLNSMLAMVAVALTLDFLEKRKIQVSMGHAALVLGVAMMALTGFRLYLVPHERYEVWLGGIEAVMALVSTRVLYDGVAFLLLGDKKHRLGNEEIISIVLLGAFGILGIPNIEVAEISLLFVTVYFFTLAMGYCYGTGAGAIVGAIGGSVLVLCGWENATIGILALMGICSGMLREQGKLLLCSSFFMVAAALHYIVNENKIQISDLEGIAIAGGVFLLIPEKYFRKIRRETGRVDNWENEKLQHLMKYKLQDFSKSFANLSRSLEQESLPKTMMEAKDMENLWETMSGQVCKRCENFQHCQGHNALTKPEMYGTLALAQEQGQILLEQMPMAFTTQCIHQERFLSEANQSIHLANMAMGYENKMLQKQRIIAEQMREVGIIVEELAQKLPDVKKMPHGIEENLEKELRRHRVAISEMAFYEKYDGRMEIYLKGRTSRGRYVTSREVTQIVSEILGKKFNMREECRKVFSREEEEFILEEGAVLKALTGVSRLPKAGEEISGDTFSCSYLPSGELLMALSDGMGSGSSAYEESEQVIELLEQMTEAGFSEESSIRLINSIFMSQEETRSFATADIVVLNLYKKTCDFVKCGASTTYFYHNGEMLKVEGQALPIGVMNDIEPYTGKSGIMEGDYVIMMTDGVADSFAQNQEELENIIYHCLEAHMGPEDLSEKVLEEAVERWGGEPEDDMSVMTVRLYEAEWR